MALRKISATWPHGASLIGVSTDLAMLVRDCFKSSRALNFSPCSAPKRKATLIFLSSTAQDGIC